MKPPSSTLHSTLPVLERRLDNATLPARFRSSLLINNLEGANHPHHLRRRRRRGFQYTYPMDGTGCLTGFGIFYGRSDRRKGKKKPLPCHARARRREILAR